jgi:hypothetical protein
MDTLLRGTGGTIRLTNYDSTEALANAGAGNASVAVADSAGIVIAGSPLVGTNVSTGTYEAQVPAALAVLDEYTATWTMPDATTRTTHFALSGGFYFTIADLRAFDVQLSDPTTQTTDKLRKIRAAVEERFEGEQGAAIAFVPRGKRLTRDGTGKKSIMLPDLLITKVVSVTIAGVALSAPDLAGILPYAHGQLVRTNGLWTFGQRNIVIQYEYGFDECPEMVAQVAKVYARHLALTSGSAFSDRATAQMTDAGNFRLTIAGRESGALA